MEVKKSTEKYQSHYEDVCIGVQQIWKTGGCIVITIPKPVIEKLKLRNKSHVMVTLHVRRKKFHDELAEDEDWVKMNRRERIMCEQFLRERKEYMEKTNESWST